MILLNVGRILSYNSTVKIYKLLCDIVRFAYTFYILLDEMGYFSQLDLVILSLWPIR